jgi:DNA-binding CsgD family transcriptional regulator/pimeloyl-ACP methyl ester carboxylesterase
MDAPPVQYVKTSDGYDIAYTTTGEGKPFILLPFLWTHVQLAWSDPFIGAMLSSLARNFRLVHYDGRGQGLSQRGLPSSFSMKDRLLDLQAVIGRLQLERPILAGDASFSHTAVRFAYEYPESVSALVLLRGTRYLSDRWNTFASLAGQNWDFFLDLSPARRELGLDVERLRASMTQHDLLRHADAIASSDIGDLLRHLRTPTLVLHARDRVELWHSVEGATEMASLIPNGLGRFAMVGGSGLWGDADETIAIIQSFLSDAEVQSASAASGRDEVGLSRRELEVLRLLAAGKSNQQMADELVISLHTVNRHVSNIYTKTGAANRAQATAFAKDHGIA